LQGQTSEAQRRREGDTLYTQCPYKLRSLDQKLKYWCLLKDGGCQQLLQTYYEYEQKTGDGRIQMRDNTINKAVSITMTDLKAEDSGTYFCAYYNSGYVQIKTISLNVFKGWVPAAPSPPRSEPLLAASCGCSESTFLILSVVLLVLLLLALVTATALGVRHYRLLLRTGNRGAEDTRDRPEGTAQPGSTGRRGSSQDDSKGSEYINLDVQSLPSPEDPLYCNLEPSQAHRNPQCVEYAVIAFKQSPRSSRE
ncbi:CLM7 protein, partial [Leucopsar rothschildi]|nr:CLM7 protein [Leucopsar rothschildi]